MYGESHIKREHMCDLKDQLPSLGLEVAEYKPAGGSIYNDVLKDVTTALLNQESDDATLVIMGSNDVRWIAEGQYKHRTSTANRKSPWGDLDEIFAAAEAGQGWLFISTPIPSPCHQRTKQSKNIWCYEEPCWHERKTAKAAKEIYEYITSKAQELPNVETIDLTTPYIHKADFMTNRQAFKYNNVHFRPMSASTLDCNVIQALSHYYQPQ